MLSTYEEVTSRQISSSAVVLDNHKRMDTNPIRYFSGAKPSPDSRETHGEK